MKKISIALMALVLGLAGRCPGAITMTNFFNWETAPVHPVALSPDGTRLVVCNLPDDRLEVFDITSGLPVSLGSVTVGLDPVTVRFRTRSELWVANSISSTISIIDLPTMRIFNTITTSNQPSDIVFAGSSGLAFVSCGGMNVVQVFNPATLQNVTNVSIDGNRPRAMATSPDGSNVYVAIFESGNASTIIGSGVTALGSLPRAEPVTLAGTPSHGIDPPPNSGNSFVPAINPALGTNVPPKVGLIVKKNNLGQWMDDDQGDWSSYITGTNAALTSRVPGWDLPDHDLAVIDSSSFTVKYATGLMNMCMGVGVNPASGAIAVIGTDAINQIRFQPVLNGIFVRVNMALIDPTALTKSVVDLNPHLTYQTPQIPQAQADLSIGDPRGIAWSADGTRGYVTGMGSDNLIIIDSQGNRVTNVDVGQGPTGLALDESRGRIYIYNRFDSSISTVAISNAAVIATSLIFNPTPAVISAGRPFLYDTHLTSGLGQAACASCHVDSRMDRLAWDLGDPTGTMGLIDSTFNFIPGSTTVTRSFHPMKGPMVTITLQDIIGHEPFHWRGDREGIEAFGPTFTNLQGMAGGVDTNEMAELKAFLATIGFPPNPFRTFSNGLSTNVPLPGVVSLGRGALQAGAPLPNGNAQHGETNFTAAVGLCDACHSVPTGLGPDMQFIATHWVQLPISTNNSHHIAIAELPRSANLPFKIPQLRNLFDKSGMNGMATNNRAGFGFSHDGSVDSVVRFVQDGFAINNDQQAADLVAFLFSFSGSDLPPAPFTDEADAPGRPSLDVPASVGSQITINNPADVPLIDSMIALAATGTNRVNLVVKGMEAGLARGWFYVRGSNVFQSDRAAETESPAALRAFAAPGTELTYTVVPGGSGERIGIDRNADGLYDRDALDIAALSGLAVNSCSVGTNGTTLGWTTIPGLSYKLQYKTNLTDPNWADLFAFAQAPSTNLSQTDTNATTNASRFYRLVAIP